MTYLCVVIELNDVCSSAYSIYCHTTSVSCVNELLMCNCGVE